MANLLFIDTNGVERYMAATGTGTDLDPYVPTRSADPQWASKFVTEADGRISLRVESVIKPPSIFLGDYGRMGTDSSGVVKNTPSHLVAFSAVNLATTVRYIQFFDRSTAPTTALVPRKSWPVKPGEPFLGTSSLLAGGMSIYARGLWFDVGIAWGMSSTPLTFTAATASETIFDARFA